MKGRTVLVTGADGFIGSHLVERLVADGAHVRAICFFNPNGSWGWLDDCSAAVQEELDVRLGDVRDAGFVERACKGVDVVFHLAALISIPFSYEAPESYVQTNVTGTLNVLEAVRRQGCSRLIQTSTSEVYGSPDELPIRETHPLKGQSPYSATKIAADKLCEAYYASFGVPVVTLRPFNTFGPRQSTRAVVTTILSQLLRGATEVKLGRTDTKRDLTFVSDTVDGFVRAAQAPRVEGKVIQLGTGRTVSVAELFELCCRASGREAILVSEEARLRPDASEVTVLLSDPSRASELLGWRAGTSLEVGLQTTALWLASNLQKYPRSGYHT